MIKKFYVDIITQASAVALYVPHENDQNEPTGTIKLIAIASHYYNNGQKITNKILMDLI